MNQPNIDHLISELKQMGITDSKVLRAISRVPREEFVPPDLKPFAYKNYPLAIGKEQTISQPYMVALMTQLLKVKPGEHILEIGTGSGYQAAILAELGAEVTSLERILPLHVNACATLSKLGYPVHCLYQDGFDLSLLQNIYDKIIITAALDKSDEISVFESKINLQHGILVVPVGSENEVQRLYQISYQKGIKKITASVFCRFVPLKKGLREA